MPIIGKEPLLFVRRESIFVQRGIGPCPFPPPSLGVSSLDLGRRLADGPFFLSGTIFLTGVAATMRGYSAAAR
jgi:hypothetical protein